MSGSNTRKTMYDKFQPWVLATYGDSAKTKTITTKKANRIVKLLQAKEKVPYVLVFNAGRNACYKHCKKL